MNTPAPPPDLRPDPRTDLRTDLRPDLRTDPDPRPDRDQHPDPDPAERLQTAKAFFNNGEFFRSYDLAREAAERWPEVHAFAHLAVLSLANAGATELAFEKFTRFGLDQREDLEAMTLLARLYKDRGFAGSKASDHTARCDFHERARAIYLAMYATAMASDLPHEAYYPGINAAALAVWCGDHEHARRLATEVLAVLQSLEDSSPAEDLYWRRATEAEAYLILGNVSQVDQLVLQLRQLAPGRYAQIATTERQLRRLADALGLPHDFLQALTLPTVAHFSGHIIAGPGRTGRFPPEEEDSVRIRIDQWLAKENVGSGYGSLAAGADILFAEALLARGAALHVVFPFALTDFVESSVAPSGSRWVQRFEICLAAARSVHYATEEGYLHHDSLFQYCSQLAMGLAVLAARHMQAPVVQCVVWDGVATSGHAGTVVDMRKWQTTGFPQHIIRCGTRETTDSLAVAAPGTAAGRPREREIHAMLFGDLHGFSRLTDRELPLFAEHIMGPFSEVVRAFRPKMAFVNTWGDGIFTVFKDVHEAASWALDIQERMKQIDHAAVGLPANLQLRLGGHLGPVYELMDPVLERINFYGAHVSRAARIEPVTPEGCVYVTETFAAVLALEDPTFACDYAGYTEMAKHYGRLRIFLLRRIIGDAGPTVLTDIERPPLQ